MHYYQDISHFRAPYKNMPMGQAEALMRQGAAAAAAPAAAAMIAPPDEFEIREFAGYKYRAISPVYVPTVAVMLNAYELLAKYADEFGREWGIAVHVSGQPVAGEDNAANWADKKAKEGLAIVLRKNIPGQPPDRIGLMATRDVTVVAQYLDNPDVAVMSEPGLGWVVPKAKTVPAEPSALAKLGISPVVLVVGVSIVAVGGIWYATRKKRG